MQVGILHKTKPPVGDLLSLKAPLNQGPHDQKYVSLCY